MCEAKIHRQHTYMRVLSVKLQLCCVLCGCGRCVVLCARVVHVSQGIKTLIFVVYAATNFCKWLNCYSLEPVSVWHCDPRSELMNVKVIHLGRLILALDFWNSQRAIWSREQAGIFKPGQIQLVCQLGPSTSDPCSLGLVRSIYISAWRAR